jgi:hypothetical protein
MFYRGIEGFSDIAEPFLENGRSITVGIAPDRGHVVMISRPAGTPIATNTANLPPGALVLELSEFEAELLAGLLPYCPFTDIGERLARSLQESIALLAAPAVEA